MFGQTLNVEPNVEEAFEEFVRSHKEAAKPDPLGGRGRDSLAMFREVGSRLLRVLRHVVEDVGRLVAALDRSRTSRELRPQWSKSWCGFFRLGDEVRSNRLQRADL